MAMAQQEAATDKGGSSILGRSGAMKLDLHPHLPGISTLKASPKWTMGGRRAMGGTHGPGPGEYSSQACEASSRLLSSPRCTFSRSGRGALEKHEVPGPGAYGFATDKVMGNGLAYSLSPRRITKGILGEDQPGPGAHELKPFVGEGPKFTHSHRLETKKTDAPGPGEYNILDEAVCEKQPKWRFGSCRREDTQAKRMNTPGPGTYAMANKMGEGPQYSMRSRRAPKLPPDTPGPGAHGGHYNTLG